MAKVLTEDIIPALKQKIEEAGGGGVRAGNLPRYVLAQEATPGSTGPVSVTRSDTTMSLSTSYANLDTGGVWAALTPLPNASTEAPGIMSVADKTKLDNLPTIKAIGDGLSLSEDGTLSGTGGGGGSTPLSTYTESPADTDVYSAGYINERLDGTEVNFGPGAKAYNYSIAMGRNATSTASNSIAIGYGAKGAFAYGAAIGSLSENTRTYEISFGNSSTSRYLANVKAGELDTDATNLAQVKQLIAESGGGGGSTVELLSAYTASPTNTQAYDAAYINERLLDGPTLRIGGAKNTTATNAISIGYQAWSTHANSVAIGANTVTSRQDEVSIGGISTRYVANVRDGVLDQDAVTVHQLNEAVGSINTLLETLVSGEGAK